MTRFDNSPRQLELVDFGRLINVNSFENHRELYCFIAKVGRKWNGKWLSNGKEHLFFQDFILVLLLKMMKMMKKTASSTATSTDYKTTQKLRLSLIRQEVKRQYNKI